MNLVSQAEFARIVGVSKQAIFIAIKNNSLTIVIEGKKKRINLNGKKTKLYLNANHKERFGNVQKIVKNNRKESAKKKREKESSKKKAVSKVKKKQEKKELIVRPVEQEDEQGNEDDESFQSQMSYLKARAEKEKETVIHKKLQNAKMRGELLDRDAVYTSIIMYLDKVHSNLERLADSYLSDVGAEIVTASKVTPAIRNRWRSGVMEQIDDAKKTVIKKISEIEKEQAG